MQDTGKAVQDTGKAVQDTGRAVQDTGKGSAPTRSYPALRSSTPVGGGISSARTRPTTASGSHGSMGRSSRSQRETHSSVAPRRAPSSACVRPKGLAGEAEHRAGNVRRIGKGHDRGSQLDLGERLRRNGELATRRAHGAHY